MTDRSEKGGQQAAEALRTLVQRLYDDGCPVVYDSQNFITLQDQLLDIAEALDPSKTICVTTIIMGSYEKITYKNMVPHVNPEGGVFLADALVEGHRIHLGPGEYIGVEFHWGEEEL